MLVSKIKSRPVSGLSYHNLIQHNFTVAGAVLGLTSSMKTHQLPDYPTKKITPLKCLASTLKIGCYCYLFTKKCQRTSKHLQIGVWGSVLDARCSMLDARCSIIIIGPKIKKPNNIACLAKYMLL